MQSRFSPFFSVLLFLISTSQVVSQNVRFNKVSLSEQTLGGVITSITQDLQGNIWFSPNNSGLCRFDGVNLRIYSHDALNPSSLVNNYVECVYADKGGNIWAGTFGFGLEKFDPKTGSFTHYKHNDNDPSSISGDSITCIIEDRDGFLWVGTSWSGLNRMDPATGKFTHFTHKQNDPTSLSFDQVRTLYEDKKGVLWVGTGSNVTINENGGKKGGLNRFNSGTSTFTRYLHDEKNSRSLIDDRVRAIFEDSNGNFWVGTAGDGLHTMDRAKGTFERHTYDPLHPEKLSRPALKNYISWADDNITFITEDAHKTIWIGSFENGMNRYDPTTKQVTHYSAKKNGGGSLSDSTTWSSYTSRDGVIWVGSLGGELYRFDPSHQNIPSIEVPTRREVWSFQELPNQYQYFGLDSGLFQINTRDKSTRLYVHDPKKPESISGNFIPALFKDRKGRLWAGTDGGLSLFNPDKENFKTYRHDPKNSKSLSDNNVFALYEDEQSHLWVGTVSGLDKMNTETGEFTHYRPFPNDTLPGPRKFIVTITEDTNHNLWLGHVNGGGIHKFNRETEQFKNYLTGVTVLGILADTNGRLWAGAETGLYIYSSASDSFTLFIDPSSGNSISTRAMVEDNNKNLWVSAQSAIYRINNDVFRFSRDFGIRDANLVPLSAHKASDGQLIFGHGTGYYSVYPEKISGNPIPPEINLSEFRIAGRPVYEGTSTALKEDLMHAKEIQLSHDQDVFSFLFNVVHYSNPETNRALYWLENYDEGWRTAGSERMAYYYGIPPGHYTFHVKAASSEGVWSEKSISVIIARPWWHAWWAYVSYGIGLVAVSFSVHKFQRARVIRSERERTQEKELAQAKEIEKAYAELKATQSKLIQSEKMASLGELTAGIAHEIQNPLNFVNNFSEVNKELLVEMKEEIEKGHLEEAKSIATNVINNQEKINHHGKRADAIVKGMLQHSRASSAVKEPIDINAMADEYLRLSYHGLRSKDKSFNARLETDFETSLGKINIIPQDIGRVLLNLLSNAFYAVNEKKKSSGLDYEPTVSIGTKKSGNQVLIFIKDNGNGIPDKVVDKIFQPFFTTKPTGQGTGLGLSLSYDIVKAHDGELTVQTKEGEGSVFIIHVPSNIDAD
jgi:signal transduction histidine kinase/ligand-binding sensor domain-containing protein